MPPGQRASRIPASSISLPFMLGFSALVGQLVLLRAFLAVFQGNELLLALLFAGWFAGIFCGALLGGQLGKRNLAVTRAGPALVMALPAVALAGVVGILTVRTWQGVSAGALLTMQHALPSVALCVFPASLIVGMAFPLLAATPAVLPSAGAAGRVYWLESAGSLAGGMLYTFVGAGRISMPAMLWICAAAGPGLVAGEAWFRSRRARGGVVSGVVSAAVLLLLLASGGVSRLDERLFGVWWAGLSPGQRLVARVDSRYQHLAVGERDGQYSVYTNGLYAGSFPDPFETRRLVNLYMNQCRTPEAVLLLGRGIEGEAQRILEYPVRRLTVVVQDPELLRVVTPLLPADERTRLNDPRVRFVAADAVEFLNRTGDVFDLMVLFTPPPATAAYNRFYTREFFALVRNRLRAGGVLVVGLEGSESHLGPEMRCYAASLDRTLRSVYPRIVAVPGTRLHFFAAGPEGAPTLDADELARRFANRDLALAAPFRAAHFRLLVPPERVGWLRRILDSEPGRLNTDRHPVIYLENLRLWDRIAGGRLQGLLNGLARLSLPVVLGAALAGLILLASLLAAVAGRGGPRLEAGCALTGMFLFGFLGMGLELVLLYHVQNLYGFLYGWVGLLIAGFMLGLAIGAWWMNRRAGLPVEKARRWAFLWLPVAEIALCGIVWGLFGRRLALGLPAVFLLMTATGALTGMYFPAGCRLYAAGRRATLATAAWVDAVDHLGALAGAGLTGLLLLPVLGIDRTMVLFVTLLVCVPFGDWVSRWASGRRLS